MRGVTFDVGGTLIFPWPSVGDVYASAANDVGVRGIDAAVVTRQFFDAWRDRKGFDYSKEAWKHLVMRSFAGTPAAGQEERFFEKLYNDFGRASAWRMYEDVLPLLEWLKRAGKRLGVISNWDERLEPLLDELGLAVHFDVIIISHRAGVAKPDARIFYEAQSQFGIPPEGLMHVGDSRSEDMEGAANAGWRGVLLDRSGASKGAIGSLEGLKKEL